MILKFSWWNFGIIRVKLHKQTAMLVGSQLEIGGIFILNWLMEILWRVAVITLAYTLCTVNVILSYYKPNPSLLNLDFDNHIWTKSIFANEASFCNNVDYEINGIFQIQIFYHL